jgi:hypothetical protein
MSLLPAYRLPPPLVLWIGFVMVPFLRPFLISMFVFGILQIQKGCAALLSPLYVYWPG